MKKKDKKVTKTKVVKAIAKLIDGYANDELTHSPDSCPLCSVYMTNGGKCRNCINTVFVGNCYYPCVNRINKYKKLNWSWRSNNKNLQEFWTEILKLVEQTPAKKFWAMIYLVFRQNLKKKYLQ